MSPLTMTMLSPCVPRSLEQLDIPSLGAVGEMQVALLPGPWVTGSLALRLVCIEASIPGLAAGLEAEEV